MDLSFPHPLVLGHRGASLQAPENTLRAFALALEQGADGVELDVQRSADGVPVVIHDETLERTTRLRGAVAARSWGELSRPDAADEPIPSLEQVAAWAAGAGAWLNVEIKAPGVERAAVEALRRAAMLERVLFSSFHPAVVRRLGELAPEATRFLLAEAWNEGVQQAVAESGAGGVCLRADAAGHLALDVLRQEGLPVIVWTVDDPERLRDLLLRGVVGVITHRPALAAQIRREVSG